MRPRLFGSTLVVALAAGCTAHPPTSADRFGEAVRNNMALQIVDPEPEDMSLPPSDGTRRALMIGRYRTDTAEKPEETVTIDD